MRPLPLSAVPPSLSWSLKMMDRSACCTETHCAGHRKCCSLCNYQLIAALCDAIQLALCIFVCELIQLYIFFDLIFLSPSWRRLIEAVATIF